LLLSGLVIIVSEMLRERWQQVPRTANSATQGGTTQRHAQIKKSLN